MAEKRKGFVDDRPIPVFLPEEAHLDPADRDTIWIRPRMGFGDKQDLLGLLVKIDKGGDVSNFDMAAYEKEMLVRNIVQWSGPTFGIRPLTVANIMKLEPEWDLIALVRKTIAERNQDAKPPKEELDQNPNLLTGATSTTVTAPGSTATLNGVSSEHDSGEILTVVPRMSRRRN